MQSQTELIPINQDENKYFSKIDKLLKNTQNVTIKLYNKQQEKAVSILKNLEENPFFQKFYNMEDKLLSNVESQVEKLYSANVPAEKQPIVFSKNKSVMNRIFVIFQKLNIVAFSQSQEIYASFSNKYQNKALYIQDLKLNVQCLSQVLYEDARDEILYPLKENFSVQIKFVKEKAMMTLNNLNSAQTKEYFTKLQQKVKEYKDVTVTFYKEKIVVQMNKESFQKNFQYIQKMLRDTYEQLRGQDFRLRMQQLKSKYNDFSSQLYEKSVSQLQQLQAIKEDSSQKSVQLYTTSVDKAQHKFQEYQNRIQERKQVLKQKYE